jgi:hypothetical protein
MMQKAPGGTDCQDFGETAMSDRTTHNKTIYMTPRNQPSVDAWRNRWRQHAALAMTRPMWTLCLRYSQCDVITEAPFGTGEKYDGIGMGWSTPGRASGINGMMSDPEGVRLMLADEQIVFGIYVGDIAVICEETVLKEAVGDGYKLFLRLYRASNDFDAQLIPFGEALLADAELAPIIRRLSVGEVVADEYSQNSCLDFDALIELSVDNLDAARVVLESPRVKNAAAPFADAIRPDWRIIVTKENMFWDPTNGIDHSARLIRDHPPVTA